MHGVGITMHDARLDGRGTGMHSTAWRGSCEVEITRVEAVSGSSAAEHRIEGRVQRCTLAPAGRLTTCPLALDELRFATRFTAQ